MAGLILKLKPGERFMLNGAVVENGPRNVRLTVRTPDARILRLRDAIHPEDADTPVKRLCYVAQLAVAGEIGEERAEERLGAGLRDLAAALEGTAEAGALPPLMAELEERNFYAILRGLRRLLPAEASLLGAADRAPGLCSAEG
ncbi:MAG TPA: flagellar biosynthesis repressor FlbT [Thermohalobaculum sp.]|nr:flagellar biosynthesis repressor FlbT [Thermohalobaculum sp.]